MRRFELRDDKSSKFWEVDQEGTSLTVRYGRIDTNGQTQTKSFPSEAKAKGELDKLIKEKTGKGYVEKTAGAVKAVAPAPALKTKAKKAPPKEEKALEKAASSDGFLDAGGGYSVALHDGKIVCRNAKGLLASVPKAVKESEVALELADLRDWLADHERECTATVEGWMLRSLPVPRAVLESVWSDPAWRRAIENAIVVPVGEDGQRDARQAGFCRDIDAKRGLGVITLDGETAWLSATAVALPHPILLVELDEFRGLALELSFTQGISQLLRETYPKPAKPPLGETAVRDYAGGTFQALSHALGLSKRLGYRVAGGSAITRSWENGRVFEARFWIGSDSPEAETETDALSWVDENEKPILLTDVGSVAYSEGIRMASQIYAGRVIPKEEQDG